ncbi:phosphatidylinositol 4-kinase beta 1-like isoform X3 [Syzygium oleosum]|uniref:phosphatidylinositol 4-kinase beta 1-like isoform X3 n=1 Tax=Syzygium oleosum TaxID=219896 RepID=UPI0024BA53AF|nr:phosphatidylinositol 4-kinase beta 1-like isoform X3 [Syzygium oleosum]
MVRLLGLTIGEADDSPREISTSRTLLASDSGETGWLIRFFNSAFFCEWIAVSYLYKHDHAGVRDYLCNRMYTLPLSGIESYLFQICYMMVHKPSPSLDKFVIDICTRSLKIALKVHWFLMAELEDNDDNEGIGRIQEKCQTAATLMGEWPPLVRPPNATASPGSSKNQVLSRILSSKQRLLSLTSSPDDNKRRSLSFSPSSGNNSQEEIGQSTPEDNNLFKKLIPGPKVRDALLFRKSVGKDDEDSGKDGFFKRFLRDSKGEDEELTSSSEGFFKRVFRDSKGKDEELTSSSDGFFKKLFRDSKSDSEDKSVSKSLEDYEKDGFFRKFFKEKSEDKKDGNDDEDKGSMEERCSKSAEDDEKEGFFRKFFREKFEDKKEGNDKVDDGNAHMDEEEPSEFSLFRKLFRVHPEDSKNIMPSEIGPGGNSFESSPGTENFFRKLFRDRDRSVEDSELFGSKKQNESLAEINLHIAEAQDSGGVCFPMGKGMYRVVHIPEDEAVLLNSREKAPYLICVEVLKSEMPSNSKDTCGSQKLSKGGIPLANGDALLPKPPPWACPLRTAQEIYRNSADRMSSSAAQAIDQAMGHKSEAKMKFVNVDLSVEKMKHQATRQKSGSSRHTEGEQITDLEWVRVVLTADPGVRMEDIQDQGPSRRKEHRRVPSTVAIEEVKAAAAKGEAPPGLPLKGAGQNSSEAQPRAGGTLKAGDALSGELWEVKRERIRKASDFGKLPGWDLRSIIVKSGDDCRQEHLAVQLISHFYDIFQEAGLPLWLRPYEVLVTSSYTALIETIPDTASLHSIKSRYPNIASLRDFFVAKYQENSPSFKLAQRNFVESMAGYSLVCYLLQVKDRHNGNLLLDEEGHIIHIDFGFMLSNSPGGVNFESAPFKLTRELLEVMDSDAEGIPSEFFDYFKVLCIQGFLTCRKHAERIILLVEMLQDSGFPCFKGGPRTIQNLRKRFHLSLTEEQCVSLVLSLISSSLDAWRTRQYDYYQRVLNGIL